MTLTQKHSRLLQLKQNNNIVFEILISKSGKRFNSFKNGLGICTEKKSLSECVIDTFDKIDFINNDFKTRLISI